MKNTVRVLIVDDLPVLQRLISKTIRQQTGMEIVGITKPGDDVVDFFRTQSADVVLVTTEFPETDGLATASAIREMDRNVPIVLCGAFSAANAASRVAASAAGVTECITKPPCTGHADGVVAYLRKELISRLITLGSRSHEQIRTMQSAAPTEFAAEEYNRPGLIRTTSKLFTRPFPLSRRLSNPLKPVIAIGASTGGPDALAHVLRQLPADISAPVLVAQHLPQGMTRVLVERLNEVAALSVREGYDGAVINPGEVWITPGGAHMTIAKRASEFVLCIKRAQAKVPNDDSVDVLFRSVAEVCGSNCLAIVMTGLGNDGIAGCRFMRHCGAEILVQDEASAAAFEMPGAVVEAGLATSVLSLEDIAPAISMRINGWMESSPNPGVVATAESIS